MILTHKVHVLTKKEELDTVRLPGKVVVVLDILFATSTMVTALAHGSPEVIPVNDGDAARAETQRHAQGSFVMAGELNAITLEGFAPPTPLALIKHGVAGRKLIYSTTNGTVAMRLCADAEEVYCGSLLNGRALVDHLLRSQPDRTVLIVCAGSANNFNLEDFYGAGYLVDLLAAGLGSGADLSDAARAARSLFRHADPFESLMDSRVGRMMVERDLVHEVEYAARLSLLDVVARFSGQVLRRVA